MSDVVISPTMASPTANKHATGNGVNGHTQKKINYPESDGQPTADNTKQFEYIVSIHAGFSALYKDNPRVFIAGDLLWYPVEGNISIRTAPDVMVVIGRPKGHRGSYIQHEENDVAPQVVFEILSPDNRRKEMVKKLAFYERYGIEEYYEYDPDRGDLTGWLRRNDQLTLIEEMEGWISPHTRVKFHLQDGLLELFYPDGTRFETYLELLDRAEREKKRAAEATDLAAQEAARAAQASILAAQETARANEAEARNAALEAELKALRQKLSIKTS